MEISAKDLRIGNYVIINYGTDLVGYVNSISKDICSVKVDSAKLEATNPYEYIQPIPLTEEWLVKFGFKIDTDLKNCLVKSGLWFNKTNMECTYCGAKLKKIKYVNQLQNLYFALTGTELTIK